MSKLLRLFLFAVLTLILSSSFSIAAEANLLSPPAGSDAQGTTEPADLPIYIQIDREMTEITLINQTGVPVDLYILALDQEGFEIARWPLHDFSETEGVTLNFADMFGVMTAGQIVSVKVVSDEHIRVVEIDESPSESILPAQFKFGVDASILSTLPPSILSPVIGSLRVTSSNLAIADGKWEFDQHKTGYHHPGGGISGSDDTYAWDVNLYSPTNYNADVGQDVYAVAEGDVVPYAGVLPSTTCGVILIAHPNKAAPEWWSGYLHLQTPVNVAVNSHVTTGTTLGKIGRSCSATNDHLHFVVYGGSNISGGLISFNAGIIERGTTCSDFGEPNGSFSSAYALSCGTTTSTPKICSSTDIDYYKVTPSSSGTMTIRMTPPADKDYDLYVYNSSQAQVCSSTAGTGVQDVCNVTVTGGQTYYIKVIGYGGASSTTSNYSLGVACPSATTTPIYEGWIDSADCTAIKGWAWDKNQPTTPINVDIYDGSTKLTTVAASIYRADLVGAGKGNGNHGFNYATPSSLKNGAAHSVSVKYAGTSTSLFGSPKSLTCSSTTTNNAPIAEAAVSKSPTGPYYGYANPLTVTKGQSVNLYFFADKDVNADAKASLDPDGWTDAANGVSSGGKAEWNTDLNQGTPTFETAIYNPSSAGAANIGPYTYTFNDTPGTYEYQMLRITDRKGAQSIVSKIRVTVVAATPAYEGWIDGADCTAIKGWAWDKNQPNTPINVDIYDGSTKLTTVAANIPRDDLVRAGKGNGNHGVNYATPSSLKNGAAHSVSVKYAGTSTSLFGSPKSIACGGTPTLLVDYGTSSTKSQGGTFTLTGSNYTPNGTITRYVNGTSIGTITANSSGFISWTWPTSCTTATGTSTVYTKDNTTGKTSNSITEVVTSNSSCTTPIYEGWIDGADCTAIKGWAWDKNQPTTPINVDIYDGSTKLTTVAANIPRDDLVRAGKGNGNHGVNYATPSSLKNGAAHSVSVKYAGTSTSLFGSPKSLTCSGYASVSQGVTVSQSPVVLGQNFTLSFTLKERHGAAKTFENIAIAILDPSGTFIFDFAMFPSVTIPAYGTKSYSAQNYIYTSRPTGTYKAVVRGKVGGVWFDFDTVDSGVTPKSFSVVR